MGIVGLGIVKGIGAVELLLHWGIGAGGAFQIYLFFQFNFFWGGRGVGEYFGWGIAEVQVYCSV